MQEPGALPESPELNLDIGVTGFTVAEIDRPIGGEAREQPDDPADDVMVSDTPRRVHPGDIWQLGLHPLICGDARDPETVTRLMAREIARMMVSDPPDTVPIDGHLGTSGRRNWNRPWKSANKPTTPR